MSGISLAKEWFRYAHNDLIVAKYSFDDLCPKQTEIAAFHSQQCAKKALKGFLIYHGLEYPKIHNLKALCAGCTQIAPSFSSIEVFCAHLTPFAVAARYQEELAPEEGITKAAIDKAQKVYDFCLSQIPELLSAGELAKE